MSQSTKRTDAEFNQLSIMFGCDPELFLFDTKTNKYVSGHTWIPGTKDKPFGLPRGGTVQLDGVAAEIGIPPSITSKDFRTHLRNTLSDIKDLLPKHITLKATPSAWFDVDYFDKEVPESCKVLGCDPDFDAYKNGAANPRPNGRIEKDGKILRTGAGHIHISWGEGFNVNDEQHRWNCLLLTRMLDKLLVPMSTLWDKDTVRATMYGKPGTYRPKSYGMEYRVLSNAWLTNTMYIDKILETIRWCMRVLFINGKDTDFWVYNPNYESYYTSTRACSRSLPFKDYDMKKIEGISIYSNKDLLDVSLMTIRSYQVTNATALVSA